MLAGVLATVHLATLKIALMLSCDSSKTTIPKLMEVLFVVQFGFMVAGIIHIRFFTKDYLFYLRSTVQSGRMIRNLALYTLIDIICLD